MFKAVLSGFRHPHVFAIYKDMEKSRDIEIVAACEDNAGAKAAAIAKGVKITHSSLAGALNEVECDIVACGDYFARRGRTAITALEHGKHFIADKPLCTSLEELNTIAALAQANDLKVGCRLSCRDSEKFNYARKLILDGAIGEVHAVHTDGQHPLCYDSRPAWYFEKGKHGGTINDIAIHAFDFIPWMTGLGFKNIAAARCWNAFAAMCPDFADAGQLMAVLDNDAGVMMDLSYATPDSISYNSPYYWRTSFWGSKGILEFSFKDDIRLIDDKSSEVKVIKTPEIEVETYLENFISDIKNEKASLNSGDVINASRWTLKAQLLARNN